MTLAITSLQFDIMQLCTPCYGNPLPIPASLLFLVHISWILSPSLSFQFCHLVRVASNLRASSPGFSGGGVGKRRKACNYVSGI